MCEFVSWVETKDKIYFLTKKQVDSPQGQALKERFPGEGELVGHAAIRAFYDIDTGTERECTDFSTPDNFPKEIVESIKNGEMRDMGYPIELLNGNNMPVRVNKAWEAYDKAWEVCDKAREVYNKAREVCDKAREVYDKTREVCDKAREVCDKAREVYDKTKEVYVKAWEAYDKAREAYGDEVNPIFWDLFANPENRNTKWR